MTFTAATSTEAMAQVREALGDDAIILATEEDAAGEVRVTAALETVAAPPGKLGGMPPQARGSVSPAPHSAPHSATTRSPAGRMRGKATGPAAAALAIIERMDESRLDALRRLEPSLDEVLPPRPGVSRAMPDTPMLDRLPSPVDRTDGAGGKRRRPPPSHIQAPTAPQTTPQTAPQIATGTAPAPVDEAETPADGPGPRNGRARPATGSGANGMGAIDQLYFAFRNNNVPAPIADYLLALAEGSGVDEPVALMEEVLRREFRFASLVQGQVPPRPILLIGPPGAGKTQTAAKLAADAVMNGRRVTLVNADTVRAGGGARLAAFADALQVPLHRVRDGYELEEALADLPEDELAVIDTEGCNPLNEQELAALTRLVDGRAIEPVLVLPDGSDPVEIMETALAFSRLGVARLIITRIDAARRHGTLLAAANSAGLAFGDSTRSALIRDGLLPLDPSSLARLLLANDHLPAIRLKTGT